MICRPAGSGGQLRRGCRVAAGGRGEWAEASLPRDLPGLGKR